MERHTPNLTGNKMIDTVFIPLAFLVALALPVVFELIILTTHN